MSKERGQLLPRQIELSSEHPRKRSAIMLSQGCWAARPPCCPTLPGHPRSASQGHKGHPGPISIIVVSLKGLCSALCWPLIFRREQNPPGSGEQHSAEQPAGHTQATACPGHCRIPACSQGHRPPPLRAVWSSRAETMAGRDCGDICV